LGKYVCVDHLSPPPHDKGKGKGKGKGRESFDVMIHNCADGITDDVVYSH